MQSYINLIYMTSDLYLLKTRGSPDYSITACIQANSFEVFEKNLFIYILSQTMTRGVRMNLNFGA